MALPAQQEDGAVVPHDSFRNRIAVIRAEKGWNYEQAELATGVKAENWRLWEKNGRKPRDYEDVCARIAAGSGFSASWIMAGGPLKSMNFARLGLVAALPGQLTLPRITTPVLVGLA